MNIGIIIFAATVFAVFFNNALHWYTQVSTYPLFAWIGREDFVKYHTEYQRRLPFSIYAPYSVLMLSNALLFFYRPAEIELFWVIFIFVLNLSVMILSLLFAAPVHYRLDREGKDERGVNQIIFYNSLRLVAATASSAIVFYLLLKILAA